MQKVKILSGFTKFEANRIYKINLQKLNWYKSKGRTKQSLIDSKVFAKSFIEKNY